MAYTLKTSGIATNLLMCLAVDSDGTTIKEWVSSDVNTNKTTTGVTTGSATWKGTSRGYFVVSGSGASPNSVQFPSGHRPVWNVTGAGGAGDGGAVFVAMNSFTGAGAGTYPFLIDDSANNTFGADGPSNKIVVNGTGRSSSTVPTNWTNGSTKFSAGANYITFDNPGWYIYHGLESGSLSLDVTGGSDAGTATNISITGVGGWTGFYTGPGNYHLVALFDRTLTTVEMQSLHDDWFSTLFDAGGGPVTVGASGSALTPGAGTAAPAFSIGL
jgi:hypothetical protein